MAFVDFRGLAIFLVRLMGDCAEDESAGRDVAVEFTVWNSDAAEPRPSDRLPVESSLNFGGDCVSVVTDSDSRGGSVAVAAVVTQPPPDGDADDDEV